MWRYGPRKRPDSNDIGWAHEYGIQEVISEQMHCLNGSSQFELDFLLFATKRVLTKKYTKKKHVLGTGASICKTPEARKTRSILCTQFCETIEEVRGEIWKRWKG